MKSQLRRLGRRLGALANAAVGYAAAALVTVLLRAIRRADRIRISDAFARFMRKVGPWRSEHRVGRANLTAAFPDKSPAENDFSDVLSSSAGTNQRSRCAASASSDRSGHGLSEAAFSAPRKNITRLILRQVG